MSIFVLINLTMENFKGLMETLKKMKGNRMGNGMWFNACII